MDRLLRRAQSARDIGQAGESGRSGFRRREYTAVSFPWTFE
jgi:hypothetical protein